MFGENCEILFDFNDSLIILFVLLPVIKAIQGVTYGKLIIVLLDDQLFEKYGYLYKVYLLLTLRDYSMFLYHD